MKKNLGLFDKIIRILVAVAVIVLYFTNVISGVLAIILLVFAVVFILTGLIGFCPIYAAFGLSTKPKE